MANDISGFGLRAQVYASNTFPAGFLISQLADDSDPLDIPSVQIADKAMGVNGDLITWAKGNPLVVNLSVIPESDDDYNLAVLFESNRPARGKFLARDTINVTVLYLDGSSVSLMNGKITDGPPASSLASAGRLKTKTYSFVFESMNRN